MSCFLSYKFDSFGIEIDAAIHLFTEKAFHHRILQQIEPNKWQTLLLTAMSPFLKSMAVACVFKA